MCYGNKPLTTTFFSVCFSEETLYFSFSFTYTHTHKYTHKHANTHHTHTPHTHTSTQTHTFTQDHSFLCVTLKVLKSNPLNIFYQTSSFRPTFTPEDEGLTLSKDIFIIGIDSFQRHLHNRD